MKKTFLPGMAVLTAVLMIFASCGKSSKAYKDLAKNYDSIAAVNQVYESQMGEMDDMIGRIISNFQEINAMEGMINLDPKKGDIQASDRDRIEDNIRMINERLKSNREEIAALNQKLAASGKRTGVLQKTVAALEKQLGEKTKEVLRLTEELQQKNIAIAALDSMVTNLKQTEAEDRQTIEMQEQTIAKQDTEINLVRYCVGTKNDLRELGIIQRNGNVASEDFQSDYYTQVDKRAFSKLPLYTRRAKLLTNHPQGSYRLIEGEDRNLTLEVINAKDFWSFSRVLVIQVN